MREHPPGLTTTSARNAPMIASDEGNLEKLTTGDS